MPSPQHRDLMQMNHENIQINYRIGSQYRDDGMGSKKLMN